MLWWWEKLGGDGVGGGKADGGVDSWMKVLVERMMGGRWWWGMGMAVCRMGGGRRKVEENGCVCRVVVVEVGGKW